MAWASIAVKCSCSRTHGGSPRIEGTSTGKALCSRPAPLALPVVVYLQTEPTRQYAPLINYQKRPTTSHYRTAKRCSITKRLHRIIISQLWGYTSVAYLFDPINSIICTPIICNNMHVPFIGVVYKAFSVAAELQLPFHLCTPTLPHCACSSITLNPLHNSSSVQPLQSLLDMWMYRRLTPKDLLHYTVSPQDERSLSYQILERWCHFRWKKTTYHCSVNRPTVFGPLPLVLLMQSVIKLIELSLKSDLNHPPSLSSFNTLSSILRPLQTCFYTTRELKT